MKAFDDCELFTIKDKIFISVWNPEVFDGQFGPDRYGPEASKKLWEYGKSLWGTDISRNDVIYRVAEHVIMYGACGYVGSLILRVEVNEN